MSNKIRTAIRVRPFLPTQKKYGSRNSLIEINQEKRQINIKEENSTLRKFHFDYLFNQSSSQEDVYKECNVSQMIDRALEGYHSTIFAYGQTGSGKTHTMQGSECVEEGGSINIDGVIPKVIKDLYRKIESFQHRRTFSISVSFLQIYNEKIFDLLNPSSLNNKNFSSNINGLRLRWNKDEQFSVENLFVFECKNQDELVKFFLYGLKNRISSSHRLNVQSSRSHSILSIKIESFENNDPSQVLSSKIQLVDLAGSERIGMTGTQGRLAKQSIDINKSLFTLRQVISILAQASKGKGKQKVHVPYRDSKLTSILKQSIGGNSYSLMIACINPNDQFIQQNISTLTYATKASFITNQPVINDDSRNKLITQLRKQIKQLNEELGKANQHIQFLTNLNNELNSTTQMDQSERNTFASTHGKSLSSGKAGINGSFTLSPIKGGSINHDEAQNENDLPMPKFKKRTTLPVNKNNNEFSQRLIQSIHMVRELLKSNKDLREQHQASNKQVEQKNLEIYELTRENEMLRQKLDLSSTYGFEKYSSKNLIQNVDVERKIFENENSNLKPRSTGVQSLGKSIATGLNQKVGRNEMSQSKGSFNYWNSVQVNQFCMNQRGIDSQPTNFMKREINTAQQSRGVSNTQRGKSSGSQRHAITPKIPTRKNWISKHSEPKKLLSFYNDPQKDPQFY